MKNILSLCLAGAALSFAPAASAADFFPGQPGFTVVGDGTTGTETVSAFIGRAGLNGTNTDNFVFQIGPDFGPTNGNGIGLGSGSVITSFSVISGVGTSLFFTAVSFFNGVNTFVVPLSELAGGSGTLNNIPIFSGNVNRLSVSYTATGNASYGGQLTFVPGGIPEPMTWAMMIIGFAAVGFAMRRRSKEVARVRYAF